MLTTTAPDGAVAGPASAVVFPQILRRRSGRRGRCGCRRLRADRGRGWSVLLPGRVTVGNGEPDRHQGGDHDQRPRRRARVGGGTTRDPAVGRIVSIHGTSFGGHWFLELSGGGPGARWRTGRCRAVARGCGCGWCFSLVRRPGLPAELLVPVRGRVDVEQQLGQCVRPTRFEQHAVDTVARSGPGTSRGRTPAAVRRPPSPRPPPVRTSPPTPTGRTTARDRPISSKTSCLLIRPSELDRRPLGGPGGHLVQQRTTAGDDEPQRVVPGDRAVRVPALHQQWCALGRVQAPDVGHLPLPGPADRTVVRDEVVLDEGPFRVEVHPGQQPALRLRDEHVRRDEVRASSAGGRGCSARSSRSPAWSRGSSRASPPGAGLPPAQSWQTAPSRKKSPLAQSSL